MIYENDGFYVPTCDGEGCGKEINLMLTTMCDAVHEMKEAGWETEHNATRYENAVLANVCFDYCPECAIKRHIGDKE